MAKLIFMVYFFFSAVSVAQAQQGFRAQGFCVSVLNDAEEPLIGAYIYVNDKAVAVADTLGRAVIPSEKLKVGDSISVSYVATKGEFVIFDQNLSVKGEYEFILEESHGTLHADAVTVKANIKKLYRRSLPMKKYPPYMFYGLYSTHFTMNITNPGDSLPYHWVAGRLEGVYTSLDFIEKFAPALSRTDAHVHALNPDPAVLDSLQRTQSRVDYINDLPLEIITNDDTTGMQQTLKYYLPRALHANHISLHRIYKPEPDYKEKEVYPEATVNYGYLGKDQDTSIFSLTYSGHRVGATSEVVVKSDLADKVNREVVGVSLSFKDTINGNSYYVKAKIRTVKLFEFSILKSDGTYFDGITYFATPVELEYRITESDGRRVNITMTNINIRSLFYETQKQSPAIRSFVYMQLHDRIRYQQEQSESYLERMVHDKKRAEEKQQKKIQRAKQ